MQTICKRSISSLRSWRRGRRGSALLIVLAFVVLMAGLVLAFFSRSILEEQVSASSANQVKVDAFTMGAVSATVSDLKQEIMEGSSVSYPVSGNNYIYYYIPTISSGTYPGTYPSMVPFPTPGVTTAYGAAFKLGQVNTTASPNAYANLIKVSLHNQKFYTVGSAYDGTETDPQRASAVSTGTTGDASGAIASGSADGTAVNGRYISAARWNKPLLLPPNTVFPFPDWIYIERAPTTSAVTYNANEVTAPNNMATSTTVVGRYAYAIYDEGGLLDANVAGVPSSIAPSASVSSNSSPVYSAYKDALAMADLTQIGLLQTQVDTIVGWRNNASAAQSQNSGSTTPLSGYASSGYTWTGSSGFTSATNYWANVITNPNGFLRPLNAWATAPASLTQTDQFFTSRQQLIQFFNQVLGGSTSTVVQSALQYLTHFSRTINQPSFVPPSGKPGTPNFPYPAYPIGYSGGNDKNGGDATINPTFLAARVTTAYTRNDGSLAAVGDPLVVKRFALSRLAWLTYMGPIADDNGNLNNNSSSSLYVAGNAAAFTTLINQLESTYGYSAAFLAKGGPTNVYRYFGLSWVPDIRIGIGDSRSKWVYNHENAAYSKTLTGALTTTNSIRTLSSSTGTYPIVTTTAGTPVTGPNRDPDFFELLKAGTTLGSLGKAYSYFTSLSAAPTAIGTSQATVDWYQEQRDNSVDLQVIQMGANIIDQFDTDSYSTAILFTDGALFGGTVQEMRGVEDLPYIYRVREGKICVVDSNPTQATLPTTSQTTISAANAGLIAVMQEPEIWNPHAWSTSNPDTNPRPTSFRIVAISTDPNSASSTAVAVTPQLTSLQWNGTPSTYTTTPNPGAVWNEANSELDFNIPLNDLYLFREPTLLIKPGVPTNSSLAIGSGHLIATTFTSTGNVLGTGGTYIKSNWPSTQIGSTDNNQYIGFLAGTGPAAWAGTVGVDGITASTPATATAGITMVTKEALITTVNGITYRMQYKDVSGNWATYDEKYMPYQAASSSNTGSFTPGDTSGTLAKLPLDQNKTFNTYQTASPYYQDNIIGTEISGLYFDPRTSRFGANPAGPNGYRSAHSDQFPLMQGSLTQGWAAGTATSGAAFTGAQAQLALSTTRPDYYAGYSYSYYGIPNAFLATGPTATGWYPATSINAIIIPGMFAQNNPAESAAVTNNSQTAFLTWAEFTSEGTTDVGGFNQYFADADTIVRRGMSAYVPTSSTWAATAPGSGQPTGLPLATATDYSGTTPAPIASEQPSRPIMLNRPFHSVADLGYVFSGTPWRNLDMSTPESGSAPLLDVFCINDTDDPNGLVAGKANLNTRQPLVLQAILNGAYKDELSAGTTSLSSTYPSDIATALTSRTSSTTSGQGPLRNISELVGRWNSSVAVGTSSVNGSKAFLGPTSDLVNATSNDLTQGLAAAGSTDDVNTRVERYRDATVRALANAGQTRVWNLMIDVIAQTGRLPTSATALNNFLVEGEQRYWVHIAIDRMTGKIIDQQVEVVKE